MVDVKALVRRSMMDSFIRIATTDQMRMITAHADDLGLTSQLSDETLDRLKPYGIHVLTIVSPYVAGVSDTGVLARPQYHHVNAMLTYPAAAEPVETTIDVTEMDWRHLIPACAVLHRLEGSLGEDHD